MNHILFCKKNLARLQKILNFFQRGRIREGQVQIFYTKRRCELILYSTRLPLPVLYLRSKKNPSTSIDLQADAPNNLFVTSNSLFYSSLALAASFGCRLFCKSSNSDCSSEYLFCSCFSRSVCLFTSSVNDCKTHYTALLDWRVSSDAVCGRGQCNLTTSYRQIVLTITAGRNKTQNNVYKHS